MHELFNADDVRQLRENYPGVTVLAHPECPPDVVAEADFAGSTAVMSDYVGKKRPARVVLLTECSMSDNVAVHHPDVEFIRPCNLCPHMKRITLSQHPRGARRKPPRSHRRSGYCRCGAPCRGKDAGDMTEILDASCRRVPSSSAAALPG